MLKTSTFLLFAGLCGAISATAEAQLCTVANNADSGAGSFRDCVQCLNVGACDEIDMGTTRHIVLETPIIFENSTVLYGRGSTLEVDFFFTGGVSLVELLDGVGVEATSLSILGPGPGGVRGILLRESASIYLGDGTISDLDTSGGPCSSLQNPVGAGFGAAIGAGPKSRIYLSGMVFEKNISCAIGGAIYARDVQTIDIDSSTFRGNVAGSGGAIYGQMRNNSLFDIQSSTFDDNVADGSGGAIYAFSLSSNVKLTVDGSTFARNAGTTGDGGAIVVAMPFAYNNGGRVLIAESIFQENFSGVAASSEGGGAIQALTRIEIERSTFFGNTSRRGGAVSLGSSVIPAAIPTFSIKDSTFDTNKVETHGGGAIWAGRATVAVTNSTFHENEADSGAFGGAIQLYHADLDVTHCTFADNLGANGSTFNTSSSSVDFISTIIQNGGGTAVFGGGPFTDLTSMCSDATCQFTDPTSVNNKDPKLKPLANYGGPTDTRPLNLTSGAIDSANWGTCPATDQRGVSRPVGSGCDMGSVEQ